MKMFLCRTSSRFQAVSHTVQTKVKSVTGQINKSHHHCLNVTECNLGFGEMSILSFCLLPTTVACRTISFEFIKYLQLSCYTLIVSLSTQIIWNKAAVLRTSNSISSVRTFIFCSESKNLDRTKVSKLSCSNAMSDNICISDTAYMDQNHSYTNAAYSNQVVRLQCSFESFHMGKKLNYINSIFFLPYSYSTHMMCIQWLQHHYQALQHLCRFVWRFRNMVVDNRETIRK